MVSLLYTKFLILVSMMTLITIKVRLFFKDYKRKG